MSEPKKRKAFAKVTTPTGVLVYPNLTKPDFKFKKENGEYKARIRLSADDAAPLIAKYEAALKAYWPEAVAEAEAKVEAAKTGAQKAAAKKALAELKESDRPFKPAYDDEGNETGDYEFNFKMPAQFTSQKGGKLVKMAPDIFNAKGVQLKNPPEIWGGTRAKVAGELRPYSTTVGVGLSLRLLAVQIIELVSEGSGSRSASSLGFGQEEGYDEEPEGPDTPSFGSDEDADAPASSGGKKDEF